MKAKLLPRHLQLYPRFVFGCTGHKLRKNGQIQPPLLFWSTRVETLLSCVINNSVLVEHCVEKCRKILFSA